MANECGTILLVCRYVFNDKPKRAIRGDQVVGLSAFSSSLLNVPANVILDTRSSCFSACNIEKLGRAWGRGYVWCSLVSCKAVRQPEFAQIQS